MEKTLMKLLGLDQSMRASGWALGAPDLDRPQFGVWRDVYWFDEADRDIDSHLLLFRDRLRMMIKKQHVTHVACEQTLIVQGRDARDTIRATQWLECMIRVECADCGVDFYQANINDWRLAFLEISRSELGTMNRDGFKAAAVDKCQELGWGAISHDAAEACGIMDYRLRQLSDDYRNRRFSLEVQ